MGGICRLPAMIVLQIDCLRGSVVPPEGDSPICIHTHRVPPRGEPLERVKPEPGHIEIPDVLCAVQDRQNASHSLLNVRAHASWIVFFPESAQGLAAESADCCVTYWSPDIQIEGYSGFTQRRRAAEKKRWFSLRAFARDSFLDGLVG